MLAVSVVKARRVRIAIFVHSFPSKTDNPAMNSTGRPFSVQVKYSSDLNRGCVSGAGEEMSNCSRISRASSGNSSTSTSCTSILRLRWSATAALPMIHHGLWAWAMTFATAHRPVASGLFSGRSRKEKGVKPKSWNRSRNRPGPGDWSPENFCRPAIRRNLWLNPEPDRG